MDSIGTADGPAAFGRIIDVAVARDSTLAIADAFGCSVHLIDLSHRGPIRSLGGCGDGPGELRDVQQIELARDTVWIFDGARQRVVSMLPDGREVGTHRPVFLEEAPGVRSMTRRGAEMIYSPLWVRSRERSLLYLEEDGTEVRGLADSELSLGNEDRSLARVGPSCAFRSGDRVVAANPWALQIVVLDDRLKSVISATTERPWYRPREQQTEGAYFPPGYPRVACGDSVAIVRYRITDTSAGRHQPRVSHSLLLTVTSHGSVAVLEEAADTAWPHASAMAPATGIGNLFFFFSNAFGPHPMIKSFRLQPLTGERDGST